MTASGTQLLEAYLRDVRRHLRELSPAEADEVVEELRSHVLDRCEGGNDPAAVSEAIAALGSASDIAEVNVTLRAIVERRNSRSPIGVLRTIRTLARVSGNAVWLLCVSIAGYLFAGSMLSLAVLKLFVPSQIGLWRMPDPVDPLDFSFGRRSPPAGAHEILGWWIVPIALALALAAALLTWRFGARRIQTIAGNWNRKADR